MLLGPPDDRGTSGDQFEEIRGRVPRLGLGPAGIRLPGFEDLGHLTGFGHPGVCSKGASPNPVGTERSAPDEHGYPGVMTLTNALAGAEQICRHGARQHDRVGLFH